MRSARDAAASSPSCWRHAPSPSSCRRPIAARLGSSLSELVHSIRRCRLCGSTGCKAANAARACRCAPVRSREHLSVLDRTLLRARRTACPCLLRSRVCSIWSMDRANNAARDKKTCVAGHVGRCRMPFVWVPSKE
eukprot:6710908-Prymnesium_polylepis.2